MPDTTSASSLPSLPSFPSFPSNALLASGERVSFRGRDDEALFARDENDALIRQEAATREQFEETVEVRIDGFRVKVPKAVPKTDSLGNKLRGADGELIPRSTTIYDAAVELVRLRAWPEAALAERIPVLCHAPHLHPVGVCRMCSVQLEKPGKGKPERKLYPACQHRVEDNMVVTTRAGLAGYNAKPEPRDVLDAKAQQQVDDLGRNIRKCVSVLAELLVADHRRPEPAVPRYRNELEAVAKTLGETWADQPDGAKPGERAAAEDRRSALLQRDPALTPGRNFQRAAPRTPAPAGLSPAGAAEYARARRVALPVVTTAVDPEPRREDTRAWVAWNAAIDEKFPYSSRTVIVDHDRCILCDRCVRSCSEVKPFKVIGHTGKGYDTRISFDLDALMSESSCVQCGECMTSCPTGALSLRRRVQPRAWAETSDPALIPQNPETPLHKSAAPDPSAEDAGAPPEPESSEFLTADDMWNVWLWYKSEASGRQVVYPFRSIPYSYLKWNEGAVRKRTYQPGVKAVLCREGEYGTTAFLLQGTGKFHIHKRDDAAAAAPRRLLDRLRGRGPRPGSDAGPLERVVPGTDFILGEMACLNHTPRNRTVLVEADPDEPGLAKRTNGRSEWADKDPAAPRSVVVYEVTRNVLDMMRRAASSRDVIREVYTRRAVYNLLGKLFAKGKMGDAAGATRFLLDAWQFGPKADKASYTVFARMRESRGRIADLLRSAPTSSTFSERRRGVAAAAIEAAVPAENLTREARWAAADALAKAPLPPDVPADHRAAAVDFLRHAVRAIEYKYVEPGEAVVTQGEPASDFYVVNLGFLRVSHTAGGRDVVVNLLRPKGDAKAAGGKHEGGPAVSDDEFYFGEVALLADDPTLRAEMPAGYETRVRTATVAAIDPSEVLRIPGAVFKALCDKFADVKRPFLEKAIERVRRSAGRLPGSPATAPAGATPRPAALPPARDAAYFADFVQLGLYQSQRGLVLDLVRCTRCDECTRACADSHPDGRARLLREGFRFGDFLVATSCRQCHKPYCMDGCPVDAIHRKGTSGHLEVRIEDHCIGCGLCERNCPYGSIHLPVRGKQADAPVAQAVNCDLCVDTGHDPFCVSACPHDAAFRWGGDKLMETVLARTATGALTVM